VASIAPVEFVLIGFPTNEFDGSMAPALARLVDSGTVRVLDLVFVRKDQDGTVTTFEYDDLAETVAFAEVDGDADGFLSDDDVASTVGQMPNDSAAMLIVWEDLWAKEFADAVLGNGGVLLAGERIPHDVVVEIVEELDNVGGGA